MVIPFKECFKNASFFFFFNREYVILILHYFSTQTPIQFHLWKKFKKVAEAELRIYLKIGKSLNCKINPEFEN